MRTSSWVLGAVAIGVLAFSCGGEEFGSDDPDATQAGESSTGEGGSGAASTGGSSVKPPTGGRAGSSSTSGSGSDPGGVPGVSVGGVPGGAGAPEEPECSDQVPPELSGDCQKLVCSMGSYTSQPDPNDTPEPRGPCDVPQCEEGQPHFASDPAQCELNQKCSEGQCSCAGCPNGKVPALSSTLCRLPATVTATANKTNMTSMAFGAGSAADGNAETRWNSGALDGILTITLASPQPMTAIAMWLTGAADNSVTPDKKTIHVSASVETSSGMGIMKAGNFSFAQSATGPLRLELGLVNATKITLTFESPSSWISVNEVIFEVCP